MSEPAKHTCSGAQNWGTDLARMDTGCAGCAAQFIALKNKEIEVLDAVRGLIGTDSMREYEVLLRVGREYVKLRDDALNADKGSR